LSLSGKRSYRVFFWFDRFALVSLADCLAAGPVHSWLRSALHANIQALLPCPMHRAPCLCRLLAPLTVFQRRLLLAPRATCWLLAPCTGSLCAGRWLHALVAGSMHRFSMCRSLAPCASCWLHAQASPCAGHWLHALVAGCMRAGFSMCRLLAPCAGTP